MDLGCNVGDLVPRWLLGNGDPSSVDDLLVEHHDRRFGVERSAEELAIDAHRAPHGGDDVVEVVVHVRFGKRSQVNQQTSLTGIGDDEIVECQNVQRDNACKGYIFY